MHRLSTSFVLGYHGCDERVANSLLAGKPFQISKNSYDWLGWGIYFWEANPRRGLEFARELKKKGLEKIKTPAVVGAVIDLGLCLDLLSSAGVAAVREAYDDFKAVWDEAGKELPQNRLGADKLLRELDCAVINHLHAIRELSGLEHFDTVRGVFIEGKEIYSDSGFMAKTHIQICVRNPRCLKGIFRVSRDQLNA